MKRNSLFLKLYVSFVVFLVIPVIVLGIVFSSGIARSFQQEVTDSSLSRVRSVRDAADEFLIQVRRTALERNDIAMMATRSPLIWPSTGSPARVIC